MKNLPMKNLRRRLQLCWLLLRGRPGFVLVEAKPGNWCALAQRTGRDAHLLAAYFYGELAREYVEAEDAQGMAAALAEAHAVLRAPP